MIPKFQWRNQFAWSLAALVVFFIGLVACQNGEEIADETAVSSPISPVSTDQEAAALPAQPPETGPYQPGAVILWNQAALEAVRQNPPRPTVTSRNLFMLHQAMYDVWALYDETAVPVLLDPALRRPASEHTTPNKAEAVSQAAYHILIAAYPAYEENTHAFSQLLQTLGYSVATSGNNTTPAGLGYIAAQFTLAERTGDGSNASQNYADTTSPIYRFPYAPLNSPDPNVLNHVGGASFGLNHWQPLRVPTGVLTNNLGFPVVDDLTPETYREQTFLTPHWGAVEGFALLHGDQFRPPPPPQAGSDEPYTDALGQTMTNNDAYYQQVNEIVTFSENLTDERKAMALYWADGPHSETPPGHWNLLAQGIAYRDHHSLDEDVKMFFVLNGALFDAGIAAWDAKRAYDFIRPISAIQHLYKGQLIRAWGGPNQGIQTIFGENWLPYQELTFLTPPFPDYVSGHSTFSSAAAAVLTAFTGSNQFFDGETMLPSDNDGDGQPDMLGWVVVTANINRIENAPAAPVVFQWETFQEAAEQAGLSRRYGGIHFQDADLRGREMGEQIGTQAFLLAQNYWNGVISH